MVEGLRSRSATNKHNGDRNDDLSMLINQLQNQMREVLHRLSRQDSTEHMNLANRLAASETKLETRHVSHLSNPLYNQNILDQRPSMHKIPFKMDIP